MSISFLCRDALNYLIEQRLLRTFNRIFDLVPLELLSFLYILSLLMCCVYVCACVINVMLGVMYALRYILSIQNCSEITLTNI